MRFHTKLFLPLLLAMPVSMGLSACSSGETKSQLNQEVKAEPAASPTTLQQQVKKDLIDNPKLTEAQRSQLRELQASTRTEYTKVHGELRQTESLLVKKLADPQASLSEVTYLKTKVRKLSNKQTDIALNSINRASEIVGKKAPMDEDFYQHFFEPDLDQPYENRMPPR